MIRYKLARPLLAWHRLRRLLSAAEPARGFRILLFHDLSGHDLARFEMFVDWLGRQTMLLTPAQAEDWLQGHFSTPNQHELPPCLLSFDDGFESNFAAARDILQPRGISALFFVCPELVEIAAGEADQRRLIADRVLANPTEADGLPGDMRFMSWRDIKQLQEMGHVIGNHGSTHARLSDLGPEQYGGEIHAARTLLETCLGSAPSWYAYAYGDIGSINGPAMREIMSAHQFCRSGVRGLNDGTLHQAAIRADHIDLKAPEAYWKLVLSGGLDRRYRHIRDALDRLSRPTSSEAR